MRVSRRRIIPSILWRNRQNKTEPCLVLRHQTVAAGFEPQIGKTSTTLVLRLNQETVTTGFEAKPEKLSPGQTKENRRTSFKAKPKKTVSVVLMPNH
jgi:hypothetical protein